MIKKKLFMGFETFYFYYCYPEILHFLGKFSDKYRFKTKKNIYFQLSDYITW